MPVISARVAGHAQADVGGLAAKRLDRPRQPVLELDGRLEAHELAGARDVEVALRLPVRPRRVPHELALEAGEPRDELGEVADGGLAPDPEVDRVGDVEVLGGEQQPARGVVDVEKLARRRAGAPQRHRRLARVDRLDELADHRRDDVRALEVEVVVGPVEVGHDRRAGIEAVLAPVGVGQHEHHLLRQAVRGVGLLRVAVPEVVLPKRRRDELRIGADGAGRHELADPGGAALLEDVRGHHEVVVDERRRVGAVEADPADVGGEVDDRLRPVDRRARRGRIAQVEVGGAHDAHVGAERVEVAHDRAAEKAGAAGHGDGAPLPVRGRRVSHARPFARCGRRAGPRSSSRRRRS